MPAQIFKDRVLAAAGPLPGQLTVENLKRWTSIRKGVFVEHFDEDVTHLLCTREQFDKRVPRVKDALKRGKRFHIIHCDWFEFSTVKNKRLPEKDFSMRNILAKQNAKRRELARLEKGKRDGEKFVNTTLYHIYRDRANFVYQVDITRDDQAAGEFGQKYTLYLWESNAKPHLYWFTAKFIKRKNSQPSYHRPSTCPDKWRPQMDLFMDFFRVKTGMPWEDRVTLAKTMPSSYFQYEPPTGGKPLGRRLRFDSEYCQQINAELRGLPWPPVEETTIGTPAEDDDPEVILEYEDGEDGASVLIDEEAAGEDAASDESDGDEPQDSDMEPNADPIQEVQSSTEDVEVEYVPSTPVSATFDNTAATASTAPSSQGPQSDGGQTPKDHVTADAENSGEISFPTHVAVSE
ncbi:hypothetical protein ACHAPT_002956 [Fusarium lateritium]